MRTYCDASGYLIPLEKRENVTEKFKRKGEQIDVSTHWRFVDDGSA
jgi:hypothetical protein